MIITCSECDTSFNLDSSLIKDKGSKVRCSVCARIFTVYPPEKTEEPSSLPEPEKDIQSETAPESDVPVEKPSIKDEILPRAEDIPEVPEERIPEEPEPVDEAEPAEAESVSDAVDEQITETEQPEIASSTEIADTVEADEPVPGFEPADAPETEVPEQAPEEAKSDSGSDTAFEAEDTLLVDIESVLDGGVDDKKEDADESLLDDLDLEFDDEADIDETTDSDEDLDFDLDFEPDTGESAETGEDKPPEMEAEDALFADVEDVLEDGVDEEAAEVDTFQMENLELDDVQKAEPDTSEGSASTELDELEMSFDLEDQDEEPASADAVSEPEDELDLSFDLEPAEEGETSEETGAGDEFDLDFDLEGEAEEPVSGDAVSELEDEFDLTFNLEAAEEETAEETGAGDELDLDLDFDLEGKDEEPVSADAVSEPEDELDLSFDLEPVVEETSEETGAGDELDLDLDFDLEGAEDEADALSEIEDSLAPTIDFEADKTSEPGPDESLDLTIDSEDTLLADINDVFTDGAGAEGKDADEDQLEDLDLELSEDVDKADAEADEDLEDLDFQLDMEFDDKESGLTEADDEIDLSDIEQMLDGTDDGEDSDMGFDDSEESIVIEKSLETEKWLEDSDNQTGEDGEINLAEIEEVLDEVDLEGPEDITEMEDEPELELDFEDQLDVDDEQSAKDTASEELRLSDFDDTLEGHEDMVSSVSQEAGDIKLEFEFDGEEAEEQDDDGLEATLAVPETEDIETSLEPKPKSKPELRKAAVRKPAPKKGVSKVLVFLLVIIVLLGGLAGTCYFLDQKGIEIPYIDKIPYLRDYFKPKVPDNGIQNLTTYDINSRFVENSKAGKLFVITGKVKNGYATAVSTVKLTGRLFAVNKTPAGNQKVYCGNMISDLELASLELVEINNRLLNRFGDNRSNAKIEPGQFIPFMVVFSNLPENLEEFTIEVAGSTVSK